MNDKHKGDLVIKVLWVILFAVIILSGCSSVKDDTPTDFTEQSRTVSIENTEQYINDLKKFIETGEKTEIFTENIAMFDVDKVSNAEIKQHYEFNGSIYIQVNDTYMYRFQLNKENKIESYIKYSIEA